MLRGISPIISSELIKYMMEMGHGDEIVLADRNFPSFSLGKRVVECYGIEICELLNAIISVFPLDQAIEYNIAVMSPEYINDELDIWSEYKRIAELGADKVMPFKRLSKIDFYEQSKKAYLVVVTGEKRRFANLILRKGIIKENE